MSTASNNLLHFAAPIPVAPEEETPFTSAEQEAALEKAKEERRLRRSAAAQARKANSEKELSATYTIVRVEDRAIGAAAMLRLKELETKAHAELDGPCKETYDSWKSQTALRAAIIDPLDEARKTYTTRMGQWDESEQRRLNSEREAALKVERDSAFARAETTILAAESRGASPAELNALVDTPMIVAPVIPAAPVKSGSGVSTRPVLKGNFDNLLALVQHIAIKGNEHLITLVDGNEGKLNKLLAAMPSIKLPGVTTYTEFASNRRGAK